MAGLTLRNVEKSYGALTVIKELNLDIHDGEFLVLVGPSGCGKSTLLRMIAGLEEISDGTIAIDGKVVNDLPASKRDLSMVFQSYALYPHMSVRKNLAFGLQNLSMPKAEIARRVDEAARILQIEPLMERKPRQLSGGQKQRVAIGRAIVREPGLFLFDEPLSNLDAELRVQMRVELAALYERLKTTMIYVTHDQVEAMTLASRIVVLRGGKIEQVGTPEELYTRPANLFVAGFIGSPRINMLKATVSGGQAKMADFAAFALPDLGTRDSELTICVRPEAIQLGGGEVQAEGKIRLVEYLGAERLVHIDLASGQRLLFHAQGADSHRAGESVTLGFDRADMHFFDSSEQRVEPALAEVA
ncbi:carbohydrate ABC transporter ATP-binding protein, CUT1 family [Pseudooceanicola antarcticus]|uniref:Carbohydrate ABC transporter ATP-binding protein, CUT1 family n=1 Tax=Pseudooceanicola antarcticus TaxID=1247613 RepID=A0A285IKY0_9RHOB|nr:sn-glycerol-3-phosphate ABC transporter ATP-binding protein UgpC [Pseudooceanicola antarcticus]PJE28661.1 sn-glycerol-3-phosphate ABC transporter ATP-binding protein UgpC [Pseudooceanicola antarcticus]SNY48622.1 carbohydrate ABC transporter ATP-binding protein, CUT1 family [Pseudooceanicola antarcticus]